MACYSSNGIPLYMQFDVAGGGFTMEATSVGTPTSRPKRSVPNGCAQDGCWRVLRRSCSFGPPGVISGAKTVDEAVAFLMVAGPAAAFRAAGG